MATSVEVLTKISEALHGDTKFKTWCSSNLGKNCNIYLGLNRRNPPPKTAYPLVAVYAISRVKRGSASNRKRYHVEIEAGVHDQAITPQGTPGQGQLFAYDGFVLAEGLREEAELAIFRKGINNRWKVDTTGDSVSENDGYFFRSNSIVDIETVASSESSTQ